MKKQFLKHYDSTVEDVFSYYYERTYDRGKSLELVREHFIKNWENLSRNKGSALRSQTVEESDVSEMAPKSSAPKNSLKHNINQFGY
ncbi:MAG: hypothetical protein M3Q63_02900 [bacterium]|nr:hypothetical protein [bacterium]